MGDYFKVYRSLLADDMWLSEPFTRGQAWIDLIGLANFGRTEKFYKGELQIVERGQIKTSYIWLSKRWKRSRNWVIHTLKQFEVLHMVSLKGTPNGTTLTIEKYALYQDAGTAKGTAKGTAPSISAGTTAGTQKKNKQRINKETRAREDIVKSEIIDGWLIETDAKGQEYARRVEQDAGTGLSG